MSELKSVAQDFPPPGDTYKAIEFFVPGTPITQGSMSMYRGRMVQSNKTKLDHWRKAVRMVATFEARKRFWRLNMDEPVRIHLTFYLRRPKNPRWPVPAVKPDLDKLTRAVCDAITKSSKHGDGVIYEDSRITELIVTKRYETNACKEGVRVHISTPPRELTDHNISKDIKWEPLHN